MCVLCPEIWIVTRRIDAMWAVELKSNKEKGLAENAGKDAEWNLKGHAVKSHPLLDRYNSRIGGHKEGTSRKIRRVAGRTDVGRHEGNTHVVRNECCGGGGRT